jgi:hypothetical protein
MQTATIQASTILADPEIDMTAGHHVGDEILLNVAAATKVKKVPSAQRSAESRAWSLQGNVD